MASPRKKATGKYAKVEQAYQKALCNQLWSLQQEGILCDVTLQVDGELIGVHSAVLSSSSAYLKDLCVQLRAMPNPNSRVIQIHHSTVSVCQKMIEYLYTGRSSQFTAEEQQDFFDLCLSWMVPNPTEYEQNMLEMKGGPSPAKKTKTAKTTQSPTKTWSDLRPIDELEDSIMMETSENDDSFAEASEVPDMGESVNEADEESRDRRSKLLVEENQEKCDLCHIIFYNRNLLVAHNVEFHYQEGMELPQEYVCTLPGCEYKTFYSKAMAAHEDYHHKTGVSVIAEPTLWKCTECGRRCSNEASLKEHQETHKQSKEVETLLCDLCSKLFTTQALLKAHIKRVHDVRDRLVCPQCGYQTVKSDIMKEHMFQKHDILPANGRLIPCEQCDHQSTCGRFATIHSLRHKTQPSCQCELCGSGFKHKRYLATHMKLIHDKSLTLLQCSECKYNTRQPYLLKLHIKSRHTEREVFFDCKVCSYKTHDKSNLRKHMRFLHGLQPDGTPTTKSTKRKPRSKKEVKPVKVTAGCDVILTSEGLDMAMSVTEYEIPPNGNSPTTVTVIQPIENNN